MKDSEQDEVALVARRAAEQLGDVGGPRVRDTVESMLRGGDGHPGQFTGALEIAGLIIGSASLALQMYQMWGPGNEQPDRAVLEREVRQRLSEATKDGQTTFRVIEVVVQETIRLRDPNQ